jgi:hypothetical protein
VVVEGEASHRRPMSREARIDALKVLVDQASGIDLHGMTVPEFIGEIAGMSQKSLAAIGIA